ncbi:hypothetical protein E3J79_02630 [Candidatus Dependentiae bacterium]|nr:MAG: hypothetical protein E3J79_02630 [Candidatus Dependentiae bacterium]
MLRRFIMFSCGILIAISLVTTPVAPINWLQKETNAAKFYCKKGVEPMKKAALCYAALSLTSVITSQISKIGGKSYYNDDYERYVHIPGPLKHIMPSEYDRSQLVHYLKAVPWTIGFLGILGYINNKWEKQKEKRKRNSSNFFFTRQH